jgi:hypothetical protein
MESHVSQSQTLDYEEVIGLAAKTRGGIRVLKRPKHKGASKARAKQPLEELDQSVPLPNLEQCIIGFQAVLHHSMERLLFLLRWDEDKVRRKQAHTLMRTLWADYLMAWKEGAEEYAELYPHVRFALRDAFLTHPSHRNMIDKALSYHALKRAREELAQRDDRKDNDDDSHNPTENQKNKASRKRTRSSLSQKVASSPLDDIPEHDDESESVNASDDDSDASEASGIDSVQDASATSTVQANTQRKSQPHTSRVAHVVRSHTTGKPKTYKDMALNPTVNPSMTMATALLFLTVYQAGVTSNQICRWIESGSLPLLNAFTMLDETQQQALRPIQYFFQMNRPISISTLEFTTTQLAAVCRLKNQPELVIREQRGKLNLRFITAKALPTILAQTIADLGLAPLVLRRCLVLVGLVGNDETNKQGDGEMEGGNKNEDSDDKDQSDNAPVKSSDGPPLSPDDITRLEDVAALIVLSCLMDPDWRQWQYSRPMMSNDDSRDRLVPLTPDQLQWLGKGRELESYVDFLEEIVLSEQESYSPNFVQLLQEDIIRTKSAAAEEEEERQVVDDNERDSNRASSDTAASYFPIAAGITLPHSDDATAMAYQKKLLLEFISHSIGLQAIQVEATMNRFLS